LGHEKNCDDTGPLCGHPFSGQADALLNFFCYLYHISLSFMKEHSITSMPNLRQSLNKTLFILIGTYISMSILTYVALKFSDKFNSESIKLSDFLGIIISFASIFTGTVAGIFAYKSLDFARKSEDGQLYIKMMERYSSSDMVDALRTLGSFHKNIENNFHNDLKIWNDQRLGGEKSALKIEEARHKVKYFYRDIMQLFQAGYLNEQLTKRILNTGGRRIFYDLVLPMEKYVNMFEFENEFAPFDKFFHAINEEQKSVSNNLTSICLIPVSVNKDNSSLMLEEINNQKIICHTYQHIINTGVFVKVAVVTNNEDIKKAIEKINGNVFYYPSGYDIETDRILEPIQKGKMDADIIVRIKWNQPFVNKILLEKLLEGFQKTNRKKIVGLMKLNKEISTSQNPNIVRVICDKNNNALYLSRNQNFGNFDQGFFYENIDIIGFTKEALLELPALALGPLYYNERIECLRYVENNMPVNMIVVDEELFEINSKEDLEKVNNIKNESNLPYSG